MPPLQKAGVDEKLFIKLACLMVTGTSPSQRRATIDSIQRWTDYAREMAISDDVLSASCSTAKGELLVLGSGLSHVDLLLNDDQYIKSADFVFHCVYDRATQIWINKLRPEALDLRILYNTVVPRNDTYICMAEAMLYRVRQGYNVVAIFYGHPGFFATPTHRAVRIARKEGHIATMRPGVSALDYLVADVGFDPMIPGLLSYEATDLIARRRRLDPTLHTVLWQVGATGELGFAPSGFVNTDFDLLSAYLESYYGRDCELVHYVAAQYVGISPLIERYKIGDLLDPEIKKRINANSTFYIPPQHVVQKREREDHHAEISCKSNEADLVNEILDQYGEREKNALLMLDVFCSDPAYTIAGPSPAAEFILDISRDVSLRKRFLADPDSVYAEDRFRALSDRARELLRIGHPLAVNAAIAEPARDEDVIASAL